jgi:DNA-directed RNA polymerase subunit M/transcription elongation factor TFIIS
MVRNEIDPSVVVSQLEAFWSNNGSRPERLIIGQVVQVEQHEQISPTGKMLAKKCPSKIGKVIDITPYQDRDDDDPTIAVKCSSCAKTWS